MKRNIITQVIASALTITIPLAACTVEDSAPTGTKAFALESGDGAGDSFTVTVYDANGDAIAVSGDDAGATLHYGGGTYAVADLDAGDDGELTVDDSGDGFVVHGDGWTLEAVNAWTNPDGSVSATLAASDGATVTISVMPEADGEPGLEPGLDTLGAANFAAADTLELVAAMEDPVEAIKDPKLREKIMKILGRAGRLLKRLAPVAAAAVIAQIIACLNAGGAPTVSFKLIPPSIDIGCVFPPAPPAPAPMPVQKNN